MSVSNIVNRIEKCFSSPEFEEDSTLIQIHTIASCFFLGAKETTKTTTPPISETALKGLRERVRKIYLEMNSRLNNYSAISRLGIYTLLWMMGSDLKGSFIHFDKALVQKAHPLHEPVPRAKLDMSRMPDAFKWGAGTCEYQVSGEVHCPHNQWAAWEKKHLPDENRTGTSTDHWSRYIEDVELLKALKINSYRFSVEWSEIEPEPGHYNQAAIEHYKDLCHRLTEAGIEPCVTLHHFSHPQWFEALGAFEKEENIDHIVRFTKRMVDELGDQVSTWFTINEPNVYSAMGYHSGFIGSYPPEGSYRYQKMFEVCANLLRAHDQMYDMIKARAPKETKVGIVCQMLDFRAKSFLEKPVASYLTWVFMTRPLMHFMRSGEFRVRIPGLVDVSYVSDKPRGDFIGVNYYSRPLVDFFAKGMMGAEENEVIQDMGFRTHPAGLYQWLRELHSIGLPLIITENGIPDKNDTHRARFIEQQLLAIQKAVEAGVDLQGYFHWAAFDNSEWDRGVGPIRFGLYDVDFETKERTLRQGAWTYINAIAAWNDEKKPRSV